MADTTSGSDQRETPAPRRVVISSLTGKPMDYPTASDSLASARPGGGAGSADAKRPVIPRRPAIPNRAPSDEGTDSNDDRLRQNVPPHWGKR